MSEANFARCLAFVLKWEGGWSENPVDPGSATMRGITLATYTRWQQAWGKPTPTKAALHAITDVEVRDIYHLWYWLGSGADKLPWPLCLAHFDLAVNGGVARANEVAEDARGDFIGYMARRIDWYTRLKTYPTFGTAWIRRCADLMLEAIKAG